MNCQTCTNSTKYVVGFWDGKDSHGQLFDCQNISCEIKLQREMIKHQYEQDKQLNIELNRKNQISMQEINEKRKSLGITISAMSKALGISPSEYSCYEQCREPLPVELRDRIEEVFRNNNYMSEMLRKYGRNK